jgi:hypothetical protein
MRDPGMPEVAIPPLVFSDAVKKFWRVRAEQEKRQKRRGARDQGARAAVTGGKQMDGFAEKFTELVVRAGLPVEAICRRGRGIVGLPGYYRPRKEWDLVVVHGGRLLAAVELKSHVGPSFGNNFNNRVEEALGTAVDTWTAYREGAFGVKPQPWLGYLLLVEDCSGSTTVTGIPPTHFAVQDVFRDTSYLQRYVIFCRRLLLEKQYHGVCLLAARKEHATRERNYTEPDPDLGAVPFLFALLKACRV